MNLDLDGDGNADLINLGIVQYRYNPYDISAKYVDAPPGKLSWHSINLDSSTASAGNWFELLDSWYDTQFANDASGGFNYYQKQSFNTSNNPSEEISH